MNLTQTEGRILLWIQDNLRTPLLDGPMKLFSLLGNAGLFWIALTLVLLAFRRTRKTGGYCAAGVALTFIICNLILKPVVARIRPYEVIDGLTLIVARATDYSFPSGHSANSFACAWMLFRIAPKRYGVPALVLAGLIALSRLYVGIHFPTDVLAGVALGILLSEIAYRVLQRHGADMAAWLRARFRKG